MKRKKQDLNEFFRKILKDFRIESNLTQREIAKLIGTGQASICNFENGKKGITLELAGKILDLLEKRLFLIEAQSKKESKRPLRVFYNEAIKGNYFLDSFDEFRSWLFKEFLSELVELKVDSKKVFDIIKFYERDSLGNILNVEEPTLTEEGEDLVILYLARSSRV